MSNATHDSRNPGDPKKRRRSRGGQNRRNQGGNPEDRSSEPRSHDRGPNRGQQQNRRQGEGRQGGEGRTQGRQDVRPARKYSAPKLSWWQKILKAVGLYKEPAKPVRQEPKEIQQPTPASDPRPVKSNTRNARTQDVEGGERRPERTRSRDRDREGGAEGEGRRDGGRDGGRERIRTERGGERRRGGDPNSVESSRVYVGNLSYDVTEGDLQELFKGVGGVRNVEVVYNRATHRSKGYGFVEMLHFDEAKRAVEILHDQPFMGRKLNVSGAKSKGQDEREEQEDEVRSDRRSQPVLASTRPAGMVEAKVEAEAAVESALTETAAETETAPSTGEEAIPAVVENEVTIALVEETLVEAPPEVITEAPPEEMHAEVPAEVHAEAQMEAPAEEVSATADSEAPASEAPEEENRENIA